MAITNSIIELPYKPPPKTGIVTDNMRGEYTPDVRLNVRKGPGTKYPIARRISAGKSIATQWRVTVYPSQDVWLSLSPGEYVGFVVGNEIFGSVAGWAAP